MFSENLKIARKRKDYTLEQLANEYNKRFGGGLSKGTLSKYEKGTTDIPTSILCKLADYYRTSTDYILMRTYEKRPYKK